MTTTLDLSAIPVVDQHCHPWRRPHPITPVTAEAYRALFTEAVDPRAAADVPWSVHYRWTLRELARVLACAPIETDVLAARTALGHEAFAARLMAEAKIEGAILDFLYAVRGSDTFTVEAMSDQLGGARTVGALRLESVLEALLHEVDDPRDLETRFRARLDREALRGEKIVALKSIVAYRTGLGLTPSSRGAAYAAFGPLKATASATGRVRIADKAFLDYFLRIALDWAAAERFPVQFHTGFGDPDVYLPTANPLILRDVLNDGRYRDLPFVFLHGAWPYVRELSYLASVYPNVYLDVGLAIPFAATEYETIISQALSLAPASKVLYSSDGFTIPEHAWFAAIQTRRALGTVLGELIDRGALGEDDALAMADLILHGNANRLYGLLPVARPRRDVLT